MHKNPDNVLLISDLNLATELQSSKVMFKLFHGLITRWVKSIYADQSDRNCSIIFTDDHGSPVKIIAL